MKKALISFILMLTTGPISFAQIEEMFEGIKQKTSEISDEAQVSRTTNAWYFQGEWAPLDMLIPNKWGLAFGYNSSASSSWEFEYIRGAISVPIIIEDLGGITEDKYSLRRRQFYSGTFNFFYGLDYVRFRIRLGNDLLSQVSMGQVDNYDVLETGAFGAHLGVGNRWAIGENMMWGIDWFTWTQPLIRNFRKDPFLDFASDEEDKDDVREALRIVEFFPRFTLFKLSFGANF